MTVITLVMNITIFLAMMGYAVIFYIDYKRGTVDRVLIYSGISMVVVALYFFSTLILRIF